MPYCGRCGKWLESGETCSCGAKDPGSARINGVKMEDAARSEQTFYDKQKAAQGQYSSAQEQYRSAQEQYRSAQNQYRDAQNQADGWEGEEAGSRTPSFWIDFKNRIGIGEPETNDVDYYERNLNIVPQCVDPDSGETPIKQYNLAILRTRIMFARSEGRLQVTNKRVIFRATGRSLMGRTTLQHEFAIDEIAGAKIRRDHRLSFFNLLGASCVMGAGAYLADIMFMKLFSRMMFNNGSTVFPGLLTLVLAVLAVIPFFTMYKKFPLKLLFLSIAFGPVLVMRQFTRSNAWMIPLVILVSLMIFTTFIICFVPNLIMEIETNGTQPAVEIRRKESSLFNMWRKPEYTGFAEVIPWKDTEIAIIELWAMISDIQKYGDSAIQQWRG